MKQRRQQILGALIGLGAQLAQFVRRPQDLDDARLFGEWGKGDLLNFYVLATDSRNSNNNR